MKDFIPVPGPINTFLSYCNDSPLDKEVLDCGAGGSRPPLALFFAQGYKTHGIEIARAELDKALRYGLKHGMDLNISLGDMRQLPFRSETLSFVYSHDTICHMTKDEVKVAVTEISRVLKPGGLCYVNFLSTEDGRYRQGERSGPGEYRLKEGTEDFFHCFFADGEPDAFFTDFRLLRKERRRVECFETESSRVWADVGYFARRK